MSRAQSPVRDQNIHINILTEKLHKVTDVIRDLKIQKKFEPIRVQLRDKQKQWGSTREKKINMFQIKSLIKILEMC